MLSSGSFLKCTRLNLPCKLYLTKNIWETGTMWQYKIRPTEHILQYFALPRLKCLVSAKNTNDIKYSQLAPQNTNLKGVINSHLPLDLGERKGADGGWMSLLVLTGKILEIHLGNKERSVLTCIKIMAKRRQLVLDFREIQSRSQSTSQLKLSSLYNHLHHLTPIN